jgi:hypothetical protein
MDRNWHGTGLRISLMDRKRKEKCGRILNMKVRIPGGFA